MDWPTTFNNVGIAFAVAMGLIGFIWAMGRV